MNLKFSTCKIKYFCLFINHSGVHCARNNVISGIVRVLFEIVREFGGGDTSDKPHVQVPWDYYETLQVFVVVNFFCSY